MKTKTMTRKVLLITLVVLFVLSVILSVSSITTLSNLYKAQQDAIVQLQQDKGTYSEDTIVLQDTTTEEATALANSLDANLRISSDGSYATLTFADTTVEEVYSDWSNRYYIDSFSLDYYTKTSDLDDDSSSEREASSPTYTVTDSYYSQQSYLNYVNLSDTWSTTQGSNITVAVIDTGIDTDHEEFEGSISQYSYNATEDKIVKDYDMSIIEDEVGHGTAVAGVIASSMNSGGVVGIAPNVELLVIKAECNSDGTFVSTSDLVFGLYYAIECDVDVVNMSFGTYATTNPFASATKLAVDSDIICVAAAGNNATTALTYPAADSNVIGVGALSEDSWELAVYSNYGENSDIVAPGSTYTTLMDGSYGTMQGTSLASPVVAGAIALYLSQYKYQTFDDVTELLYASSYDLGGLGEDWDYGYGALDIYSFVLGERGTVTFNMLTDELDNTTQTFISGNPLQNLPVPERTYAVFDGWYYDIYCTEALDWYADSFTSDLTLYANWVNEDDGVPYTYITLADGTVEITSYTGSRRYITIPDTIDGKTVSSIGDFTFSGQTTIRQITLPQGLVNIGRYAFYNCANLTDMTIPEGVTTIGDYAFYNNSRLYNISFATNSVLTTIGNYAFANCSSLTSITLPATVTYLDGTMFLGDISMRSISINSGNKYYNSAGGVLFNNTGSTLVAYPAGLTGEYTLPNSVTNIGDYAFGYARITSIDLSNVNYIGNYSFMYSALTSLTIPDCTISMGGGCFSYNFYLTTVELGSGITEIPSLAFLSNSRLTSINIPSNIAIIGSSAFSCCASLTVLTFSSSSNLTVVGSGAFSSCSILALNIPSSVVAIGSKAFYKNTYLSELTFGDNSNLQSIGSYAFANTLSLDSVALPSNLVYIYSGAFMDSGITSIYLPANVEYIGSYAFMGSGLASIDIPASVSYLGEGAFAMCSNLTAIDVDSANQYYTSVDGVVYSSDMSTITHYPTGSSSTTYTIHSNTTTVGGSAFYGASNLKKVTLPEGIDTISSYAFYLCTSVTSYSIPTTLVDIDDYAFAYNISITSFAVPDNTTSIGRYAFSYDYDLKSITFGTDSQLDRISYATFANTGITTFTVPSNVSTISQYAFAGSDSLTSITFADNSQVSSITAYMFLGCSNLKYITFGDGSALTNIQAHAFDSLTSLISVDFGDAAITNIDNYAFRFCESLTSIAIPSGVEYIGRFAFCGCNSLTRIDVPSSVQYVGAYAFYNTNSVTDVYFEADLLPTYLVENWDMGIRGYYVGVKEVITDGDWTYAVLNSGYTSIVRYSGSETALDLTALDFGTIVTIGGYAFQNSLITSIVLPETLTTISAYAFQLCRIESIVIPASVQFIGRNAFEKSFIQTLQFGEDSQLVTIEQYAFATTRYLDSVVIPASVTTLGSYVFYQSTITSLTFQEGTALTEISQYAFAASNITSVVIPDSVTLINHSAFRDCTSLAAVTFGTGELQLMSNVFYNTALASVYIPANLTYIGEYAFVGLEGLQAFVVDEDNGYYASVDGILYDKAVNKVIAVPAGITGNITLPATVENLGFGAFENSSITSITFAENSNILTLGYRAFYGATELVSITLPASVVSIDYYAFAMCSSLETVIFESNENLKGVYEGAFYGCSSLSNIVLPDSIVEISDYAFFGCVSLEQMPLSSNSGLLGIYDYAFAYTGITDIVLPATVIDIGNYAFRGSSATSITIDVDDPTQLIIGLGAFADCDNLVDITLPFIGGEQDSSTVYWFAYIFGAGSYAAGSTYLPASLANVTITGDITEIAYGAFYGLDTLQTIDLPDSISYVDNYAFYGTTAVYELTSAITVGVTYFSGSSTYGSYVFGKGISGTLVLAEGNTSIGSYAFYGCSNLEGIVIPDSVASIGDSAFSGCSNLQNIYITNLASYVSIGYYSLTCNPMYYASNLYLNGELVTDITAEQLEGVTSISSYALISCNSLTSITIPDSVASIGYSAFRDCSSLVDITISETVTSIGSYAFYGCTNLIDVVFDGDSQLTSIGNSAFRSCTSLVSITIPDSVVSIIDYAFYGCSDLATVAIGDDSNIESIGTYAFYDCTSLNSITLPDGVASIGKYAFYNCASLSSIIIPECVTSIGDYAFQYCGKLINVQLCGDNKQISIGNYAFDYCINLSEVQLSGANLLVSIGNYAFRNCLNLQRISNSNNISSIGNYAFYYCGKLENISFADSLDSIGINAFYYCSSLVSVVIPEGTSSIGSCAFYGCTSLVSINIPSTVECIEAYTFKGCSSLTSVTIPEGVASIGSYAFSECISLESATILEGVTTIGNNAFYECTSLLRLAIPNSLVSIGSSAFSNCTSLIGLYISDITSYLNISYDGAWSYPMRYASELYIDDVLATSVVIPNSITSINAYSFYGCTSLVSITIPASIVSIGSYAFYNCNNLENVYIEDITSYLSISYADSYSYLMKYADNLYLDYRLMTDVVIPDDITVIDGYAFDGCASITSVTIPASVTSIGSYAFCDCSKLTTVIFDSDSQLSSIVNSAFRNCSSLVDITLPDSVSSLGGDVFYSCTSLTSIAIPDGVICINSSTFYDCSSLTSITIPDSVTYIYYNAFYNCTSLQDLYITDLVSYLNINFSSYSCNPMYYACNLYVNGDLVTDLVIPEGVTSIISYAFYGCTSLSSVTIPSTVTSIDTNAFLGCIKLYTVCNNSNVVLNIAYTNNGYVSYYAKVIVDSNGNITYKSGSSDIVYIDTVDGFRFMHDSGEYYLIAYMGSEDTVTLPADISGYSYQLYYMIGVTNVIIPDSFTSIDSYAFRSCTSLKSVTIPYSVTSIDEYAFYGCTKLTTVTFDGDSKLETIGSSAFSYCSSLASITLPATVSSIGGLAFNCCVSLGSIVIPAGISIIEVGTFGSCYSLTSISIPDSVTSIGNYTFAECRSLLSIVIPEDVTDIGIGAFAGCSSLTNIIIPEAVESIDLNAFQNCTNLTSISIPDGVTSIGNSVFSNCTSLEYAYIGAGITSISGMFSGCTSLVDVVLSSDNTSMSIVDGVVYSYDMTTLMFNICGPETLYIPDSVTTISSYAFQACSTVYNIIIPSSITSIANYTFYGCSSLIDIAIPDSVSSIGNYAFAECTSLAGITIPNSVSSIGEYAFDGCQSLQSISFQSDGQLTSIDKYAFYGCTGLLSVTIPDFIDSIDSYAFYGCTALVSVIILDSVSSIGYYAFAGCTSLVSVTIPDSVTSIVERAFFGCTSLVSVTIPNSVTSIGNSAFSGCTSLTSLTLPDSVESMGDAIFYNCSSLIDVYITDMASYLNSSFGSSASCPMYYADNLYLNGELVTEVVIPEGITNITDYAFYGCTSIVSVTIPDSVTSIGAGAFSGCTNLQNLYISELDSYINIGYTSYTSNPIYYAQNLYINGELATDIVLPDGLEDVPSYVFYGCTSLVSVTIPEGITSIGSYAFYGCSSLTSITIADSVGSIGTYAFYECSSLQSLYITDIASYLNISYGGGYSYPMQYASRLYLNGELVTDIVVSDGVETIPSLAFHGCTSLTNISIPDSVTSIGEYAFYGCTSLVSITIPDGVTSIGRSAFSGCSSLTSITIPDSVTSIGEYTFYGCTSLVSITIPDGVISIGQYAFEGCSSLVSITIPDSVTSIGYSAFYDCSSLTSIIIPDGVTSISGSAFYGCTSLTNITIPNKVAIIYAYTFSGCTSLTNVTISEGVTSIGNYAFSDCSSLVSITIPDSITSIGQNAFYGCSSLQNVYITDLVSYLNISYGSSFSYPMSYANNLYLNGQLVTDISVEQLEDVTSIPSYAFYGCTSLASITIPDGVTSIGSYAFYGCTSLTSITIPDSVTSIGSSAFSGCSSLTTIIFEGDSELSTIESYAFNNCCSLYSITIPGSVASIGSNAFYGCSCLFEIYNCSNLALIMGNTGNGYVAYYARVIVDSDGNKTYLDEDSGFTYIDTADGFRFIHDSGNYTLIAYIGSDDTVTLPEGIDGNSYDLYYMRGVVNVILPDSFTTISTSAFRDCTSLVSIVIPEGVESIGNSAFSGCTSLVEITIPDSVESIGNYAFYGCTSLADITMGSGVSSIGTGALSNTAWLANATYTDGILHLGNWLIDVDASVQYVVMQDNANYIYSGAFDGCYLLTQVTICGDNYNALSSLSNLETLIIADLPSYSIYSYFGSSSNIPITLSTIVISNTSYMTSNMFANISGVNIYVDGLEIDTLWDDVYPGWNNGNKVYYGDEWITANFYDMDGNMLDSSVYLTSNVIRQPYYSIASNEQYLYTLVGWDIDGDGIADKVPATSSANINAYAIVERNIMQYSVNFYDDDGTTLLYSHTYEYGESIILPAEPNKTGFSFDGWSGYTNGILVSSDMDMYAMWTHDGNGCEYGDPVWVDATCSSAGYWKYTCAICGEWYAVYEGEALECEYTAVTTAPTCTEQGYTTYTCSNCGSSYIADYTDALGCNFGEWITVVEPTCTEQGEAQRICSVCGAVETMVLDPLGHTFEVTVTLEATCSTEGELTYTCTECGTTYTEAIPAIAHSYEKVYTNALYILWLKIYLPDALVGYDSSGAYYYRCSECGTIQTTSSDMFTTSTASASSMCSCSNTTDWQLISEATCTIPEMYGKYCLDCGELVSVMTVGDALGHSLVYVEALAPTCTADGYEAYWKCSVCGELFSDEGGTVSIDSPVVVSALGHSYTAVATSPTCTEQGYTTYTCSICGDSYVDDYTDALGHTLEYVEALAPTCTTDGYEAYWKCSVCSDLFSDEDGTTSIDRPIVIDALGHSYTTVVTAPTCTEQGYTTYTCSVCGDSYISDYVDALGHTLEYVEAQAPTCTIDGYEAYWKCSCGAMFSDEAGTTSIDTPIAIAALGHSYSTVVTAPTCTEQGYTTYTCSVCGDSYISDYTDALGHTLEYVEALAPTCTTDGYEAYWICSVCGAMFSDEDGTTSINSPIVIDTIAHSLEYVEALVATCTTDGYEAYWKCSVCGELFSDKYGLVSIDSPIVIKALGHSYTAVVTSPTCTEQGYTTYKCSVCGGSYISDYTDALGHTLVYVPTLAATCTTDGYEEYWKCSVCGAMFIDELGTVSIDSPIVINALDHSYTSIVTVPTCTEQGYTTYTCSVCGDSYISNYVDALGHTLVYVPGLAVTCTTEGYEEYWQCSVCGAMFSDELGTVPIDSPVLLVSPWHEYEMVVTPPTCSEQGYTAYVCNVCGNVVVIDYTDKLSHTLEYVEALVPTCTTDGYQAYWQCSVCDAMFSDEYGTTSIDAPIVVSALGHTLVYVEALAPTCTTDGYEAYWQCSVCGGLFSDEDGTTSIDAPIVVSALGHTASDWIIVTVATFDTEGYMYKKCTVCGEVVDEQTIAKLVDSDMVAAYNNMITATTMADKYTAIVAFAQYIDTYTADQLGSYYNGYLDACDSYNSILQQAQADLSTAENVAASIVKLATVLASLSTITACACLRKWY